LAFENFPLTQSHPYALIAAEAAAARRALQEILGNSRSHIRKTGVSWNRHPGPPWATQWVLDLEKFGITIKHGYVTKTDQGRPHERHPKRRSTAPVAFLSMGRDYDDARVLNALLRPWRNDQMEEIMKPKHKCKRNTQRNQTKGFNY